MGALEAQRRALGPILVEAWVVVAKGRVNSEGFLETLTRESEKRVFQVGGTARAKTEVV